MIPLQLTLRNFLSYREATLDFRGLHVACICGANGAGKSSLLEAIAWALWGQSRAVAEDDVIHQGSIEALVDFIFQSQQQTYRIIRSRHRGQATSLELQVQTPLGFRALTEKGVRATQQLILQHLKLDYDTFINSAYLRQGRADEFMLKRPADRKQILTDLLKLDRYDQLAERAKEKARELKAEVMLLERQLESIARQLQQADALATEQARLTAVLTDLQQQQQTDQVTLRQQQATQQQRQAYLQQMALQQQQQQHVMQDGQRLDRDLSTAQQQLHQLTAVLQEAETIGRRYQEWQQLQAEEEIQTTKFQAHQAAQIQRQQLHQRYMEQAKALQDQRHQLEARLEALCQQQQDNQRILGKAADITIGVAHLQQARTRLIHLDQVQMKAAPLMQRQQQIQSQIDRAQTRLSTRLDELRISQQQLMRQQQQQSHLQQALEELSQQIEYLEQRRLYQQQVREKGVERRNFLERLQERQRDYERDLAEVEQKILLLHREQRGESGHGVNRETIDRQVSNQTISDRTVDDQDVGDRQRIAQTVLAKEPVLAKELVGDYSSAVIQLDPVMQVELLAETQSGIELETQLGMELETKSEMESEPSLDMTGQSDVNSHNSQTDSLYPPCPLCDRPLDEQHWQHVMEHHQDEKRQVQHQLWVIREQLTTSDREIRVLRQEYRDVDKELIDYHDLLERRGQLQAQLQSVRDRQVRLQVMEQEIEQVQQSLQHKNYAIELQEESRLIEQSLQQLNYDDKDHALMRGEVDRWRWAEIKQGEIRQAQRRQAQLADQQPGLEAEMAAIDRQLQALPTSSLAQQLQDFDRYLADIGYDLDRHTALRQALRQAQAWQLRYQELLQAQQQFPRAQQQVHELLHLRAQCQQAAQTIAAQIQAVEQQLGQIPDPTDAMQAIEREMQRRQQQLDGHFADLGRLQQQQQQLEALQEQHVVFSGQLETLRYQCHLYQELTQAFGKNGLQAMMIENVLPQLEAETNQILGRLSANQLHVQFVTQRAKRGSGAASRQAKLIDTLDILISDTQGTRPYETYSGGEAFRVNFAIRLALARLLAQRSGTALQMLIVDEGFGTQDDAGCDRLIGAINAIAADFACILTVTHIPHLKEAFQTRIEVYKTEQGSQLRFLV